MVNPAVPCYAGERWAVQAVKVLVLSDSHGAFGAVEEILEGNSEAKCVIFLGDGEEELCDMQNLHPERTFYGVRGNCDWGSTLPEERIVEAGGHRIFCTHGHRYGVKSGDLSLLRAAAEKNGCDIALYGHTHTARTEYERGIWLCNPGSVRFSDETPAGYLELNLDGKNVVPILVPMD